MLEVGVWPCVCEPCVGETGALACQNSKKKTGKRGECTVDGVNLGLNSAATLPSVLWSPGDADTPLMGQFSSMYKINEKQSEGKMSLDGRRGLA